jgi:hypothetical protein
MFGIHYLKTSPTQYVLHYQNGRIQHQGTGQAFFYYKPSSTVVIVPVGSADVPFIFNEATADFQPITVQGQLTYRIQDPELVASLLNYTVAGATDEYVTDDPDKLAQRLVNLVQVATRAEVQKRPLRQAIQASDEIVAEVLQAVTDAPALSALGVEILTFSILAIKPNPETTRALEAEARENLLRQADNAIYDRRNSAVEQERRIKENELNTELAVEEKKQQIREAQVEADLAVERKQQEIREAQLEGQIKLENERKQFVTARVENAQAEADVQAYAVAASLKPLQELDEDVLQLLAMQSAEPRLLVTQALKELAQNASKIGQLNISPDLLESLMQQK